MKRVQVIDSGVVISQPDNVLGYNAWPSIAKDDAGNLLVVCSGNRIMHVCPYGKVVMLKSRDEGKTWSAPMLPVDTPLDDRDAGILNLGGGKMAISTFNNSMEFQHENATREGFGYGSQDRKAMALAYLPNVDAETQERYLGSLMSLSEDDGHSWSAPYKVPLTAPHGPNILKDGSVIYAGVPFPSSPVGTSHPVHVYKSDNYHDFYKLAEIPVCPELPQGLHCECHVVELDSGRLVLHIRAEEIGKPYEERLFSIAQSISDDGGKTWSVPRLTGAAGSPPHLLHHSTGAVICVYGKRRPTYGIQAMISRDNAETWDLDYYLWDQGQNADLGYPASVELANGDIFTVFYAIIPGQKLCSILWTRWKLPQ